MSADPLDDVLMPEYTPAPSFKKTLRDRTTRLIGRRLWRRRITWAAAACLIFAAGMGVMAWLKNAEVREAHARARFAESGEAAGGLFVSDKPSPQPEEFRAPHEKSDIKPTTPRGLEWQAFDAKPGPEKSKLLFDAGQKYLHDKKDIAAAVRCYAEALDHIDRRIVEISEDDDFLVMALKLDQQKEK